MKKLALVLMMLILTVPAFAAETKVEKPETKAQESVDKLKQLYAMKGEKTTQKEIIENQLAQINAEIVNILQAQQ